MISLQGLTKKKQNTRRVYRFTAPNPQPTCSPGRQQQIQISHIYSSIFRHTRHKQTYSGIVQAYSEPCIILAYSGVLYIKNPGIFKTRSIFRTMVYPKLWQIQNQRHIKNQKHAQNLAKPL